MGLAEMNDRYLCLSNDLYTILIIMQYNYIDIKAFIDLHINIMINNKSYAVVINKIKIPNNNCDY